MLTLWKPLFPPRIFSRQLGLGFGFFIITISNGKCLKKEGAFCKHFSQTVASIHPIQDHKVCFSSILTVCINQKSLLEGRNVHHDIITCGLERNPNIEQLLVRMYATCEAMEESLILFSCLQEKDISIWNSILIDASHGRGRRNHGKLHLFQQMLHEGTFPNKSTFVKILSCFTHDSECHFEGLRLHIYLRNMGFECDTMVGTMLINMYGKNGNLLYSWMAFEHINIKDTVLCTAMIGLYARHQKMIDALHMFSLMQGVYHLMPNKVTFLCLVDACGGCQGLSEGKIVHHVIVESGFSLEVMVCNSLVDMYGKCCSLEEARRVFKDTNKKNDVSWSVIVSAHIYNQCINEAFRLFYEMHRCGIKPNRATFICILEACTYVNGALIHTYLVENSYDSDQIVSTALISFYSKCNNVRDAREVFVKMPKKDVIAWNAMISGCANSDHFQAIQIFNQMQFEQLKPNTSTCVSILDSCAKNMDLDEGKRIHAFIVKNKIEQDVVLQTAIMIMYGKCGDVNSAYSLFAKIQKRNIITWNAIISIYAQNGHIHDAIVVLKQMQERKVKPNSLTFIAILDACGESVALDEGQWIHAFIVDADIELNSSLVSTLINMYGKCGLLENAWKMYESFSEKNEVLMTTFMAVLAKHGHADSVFHLLFIMHDRGLKPNHVTFINILTACNYDGLVKVAYQLFVSMYNVNCNSKP